MTDEEIKEMLKDIIDNGAEYEFRWLRTDGWSNWKSYRLGEEILSNDSRYEYRKVEKYVVAKFTGAYSVGLKSGLSKNATIYFESKSKEECEKWIEEHTKKTWLEKYLDVNCDDKIEAHNSKIDIKNVCKKIMEELPKYLSESLYCEVVGNLRLVFKDLGIEL